MGKGIGLVVRSVALIFVCLFVTSQVSEAQIVTERTPVGTNQSGLRSVATLPTLRLPYFDTDSARYEMERTDKSTRSYHFAHKLYTDIDIIRDGQRIDGDGKTAWMYRVRSKGALSLNFFFDKFHLPEGGALYIYTPDMTRMIGGFGAINNNVNNALPTGLIAADDVIIECQVPSGSGLPRLHLAEVNHGVRATHIQGEPRFTETLRNQVLCTPEISCMPEMETVGRSVVVLAVNGTSMGTGMLINNTNNDGTPYLISAAHVLSGNCVWTEYSRLATTVVAYFNYNSSACSGEVRGNVEQSVAGATLVGIDTTSDAVLVQLNVSPPRDYVPYYSGWNAGTDYTVVPYYNIHHPHVLTKRVNVSYRTATLGTFGGGGSCNIAQQRHLVLPGWDIGTTAAGSSGSPLFDSNKRFIGALTGGDTYCTNQNANDYFYSLQVLSTLDNDGARKIMAALRPNSPAVTSCAEYEPYKASVRVVRASHISGINNKSSLASLTSSHTRNEVLGIGSGTTALGEQFKLSAGTEIVGFYTVMKFSEEQSPSTPLSYEIYDKNASTPLASGRITFDRLQTYNTSSNDFTDKERSTAYYLEVYTPLPSPIKVSSTGEYIISLNTDSFDPLITPVLQQKSIDRNTLFRRKNNVWVASKDDNTLPFAAAMWIDPLLTAKEIDSNGGESDRLFELVRYSTSTLTVLINGYEEGGHAELYIHDLLGRSLHKEVLVDKGTTLETARFEGYGILIFTVKYNGKEEHLKVYLPSI